MECVTCKASTANPKFCSRRCSAISTNSTNPRRKRVPRVCKSCGCETTARRKLCDKCLTVDWSEVTYGAIRDIRKYQKNSRIRQLARRLTKDFDKECQICGYSTHVEICHIEPISSFNDEAKISDINNLSNIAILCPNHHWELDHGYISVLSLRDKVSIF